VDLARVEVAVLDKDRRPVRGLAAADFEVLEDGSPRPIVAFTQVDAPGPPPQATGTASWVDEVARDVAINQSRDLRRITIVMDDAMTPPDPRVMGTAKEIARGIIDRLGPGDEAAVVFTMFSRASQAFTSDRARLVAAIEGFQPRHTSRGAEHPDTAAAIASAESLGSVVDYLTASRDRRKVVAFISPGAPISQVIPPSSADGDLAIQTWKAMLRRAARANVTIYGFDPTGLEGLESGVLTADISIPTPATAGASRPPASAVAARIRERSELQREFLLATAENTGGRAVSRTNDMQPALDTMFAEIGTHYLLGFTPAAAKGRGDRRLQIRVLRPDLVVRAANAYDPAISNASTADALSRDSDLARVLRAPAPTSGVSLHLATAAFASPTPTTPSTTKVAVIVGVDLPLDEGNRVMTERAELLVRAYDPTGEPRGSRTAVADLALRPTSARRTHYEVMTDLDLRPGRHEIRVALFSRRQNRSGSVFHTIDVPEFSNPSLALSDVVLSTVPSLRAATHNVFVRLLPVQPTSSREFPRTILVSALVRIYRAVEQNAAAPSIRTTLTDSSGRVVMDTNEAIDVARLDTRGAADVQIRIPIKDLAIGEYLLKVEATSATVRAQRTARFTLVN
jgi:VWFA-related protein